MSRDTYFNPALLLHLRGVVLGLGSIDSDPLARRCEIVGAANGRPLPVLHLGDCGGKRRCRGRGHRRHQKDANKGDLTGRAEEAAERALGIKMRYATKSRPLTGRAGDHPRYREGRGWCRDELMTARSLKFPSWRANQRLHGRPTGSPLTTEALHYRLPAPAKPRLNPRIAVPAQEFTVSRRLLNSTDRESN